MDVLWIEQHKVRNTRHAAYLFTSTATDFSRFTGIERRPAKREMLLPGSSASRLPVVAERGAISFAQSGDQRDEPPIQPPGQNRGSGSF